MRAVFVPLLLVVLAATLSPAWAYQPAEQNEDYEILLPAFDTYRHDSYARLIGSEAAVRSLNDRLGGQWRVYEWNPRTGSPRWVYGGGGNALAASVTSATQLEELAVQLIEEQPAVFGADVSQLRLSATPHAQSKWAAHFQQVYEGLEVWDAKVRVVLSDAGQLVVMGSDYYPGIELDTTPVLSSAEAVLLAKVGLPYDPATDSIEDEITLLVLPYPLSETEVEHHLVWRVRVHTEDPVGIWVTHVDAHDGEILWRYNDVHFAYSGSCESDVEPLTYCNGMFTQDARYVEVDVSGVGDVISDENGEWSIAGSGGNRSVSARCYGPYCNVYSVSGGSISWYNGVVQEDVPLAISFDDGNFRRDERDVFDAVNDVHDFFKMFASDFAFVDNRMMARVNISDCCNAYWNGTINFYTECGGCANTGQIQDVVHHEFGHGVQANILGWQGNEGLGEGNSDILATLMTLDNQMGRGFYLDQCNFGLRNADNNMIYPDDLTGQVHNDGMIILGFNWHALVPMMEEYGEETGRLTNASNWHYGRVLLHPTNQPAQVLATFTADDDDGNLANGTPNWPFYAAAAERHGFDVPEITEGVLITHAALDPTMNTLNPYGVNADIVSTEAPLDGSSVSLYWRLADETMWTVEAMTPSGMGGSYAGEIPAQDHGTVEYYVYAEDTFGGSGTSPFGAPLFFHSFQVAWHVDLMEASGSWQVGDPGDTASDGIWERVDPVGSGSQPEDDHTTYGTDCWITGQHEPGQPDATSDVDGGITSLLSPVYNLNGATEISFSFWRWFTTSSIDVWRAWASNDAGASWSLLEMQSFPTSDWSRRSFDLLDTFPEPDQVRFKFTVQDVGPDTVVEGGVDDLVIAAVFGSTGTGDGMAIEFVTELGQNVPNPFNPRTEIRFSLAVDGPASLRIYDVSGHVVKTLAEGSFPAGEQRVVWDGTGESGRPVASGVYFYRLEANSRIQSRRMVLLK